MVKIGIIFTRLKTFPFELASGSRETMCCHVWSINIFSILAAVGFLGYDNDISWFNPRISEF
jgi:hypothetical protein